MADTSRVRLITRLFVFIGDISFLFSVSLIVHWLLQLIPFYVDTPTVFVIFYLIYFPLTVTKFGGTFGKLLFGLSVNSVGNKPTLITSILREIVYKIFIPFVLPLYLINAFNLSRYF